MHFCRLAGGQLHFQFQNLHFRIHKRPSVASLQQEPICAVKGCLHFERMEVYGVEVASCRLQEYDILRCVEDAELGENDAMKCLTSNVLQK